jgi:PRTRC genetic system protein F
MIYWYGEADESYALDMECDGEAADRDEVRARMVTRAAIDEAFPSWATEWHERRKSLSLRELKRIATSARSLRVRCVVAQALSLASLNLSDAFRPQADGEFVGYGAVLTWRADDITVRVFDDHGNGAVQAEYVDWIGEAEFDLDDPETLRGWLTAIEPHLEGIRRLDALIHELSTGDWSRVPKGVR